MLCEEGGYEGLSKTYHIREEYTVVCIQYLFCGHNSLLLVIQLHEPFRQICFEILVNIDVFLEVFIQKFEVKVIWDYLVVEPGLFIDSVDIVH